ncbi:Ribose-5-phosphate isomerase A [Candidatus Promineifilum breve]|uniref:Ribose-5-phosphate isomerase A n=1 Tax=Candidatus Promineifilum breve TaxID=1806508 RepID=A0A160T364_9CHLR|nr:ribose-5-phosphate isomerase RpiA [Candidatus Promineifilum breve]CUS04112.2 Ribose-5-phosphate isomerase A [Candidatus Promineifilum breve]
MTSEELKRQAAERAVEAIQSGMVVGLGTGSTAVHAVRRLGALLAEGRLQRIIGIPTSEATAREARQAGIPLGTLDDHPSIDVAIDGADEIDPQLNLIKGLGGALLREKIVAAAARRLIIMADDSKRVEQLGTRAPVPVEVVPFARRPAADYLASLGARVVVRQRDGQPFITDEGNVILDCHFAGLPHPGEIAQLIRAQPGVVEHGLFLGMASEAVVAGARGVFVLER